MGRRQDPSTARTWYNDRSWRRRRQAQLDKHPFCEACLERRGVPILAEVVDHVIEHNGDWTSFITGPIRSLCRECHERRHGRLRPWTGLDGWVVDDGWLEPDTPTSAQPKSKSAAEEARRRRNLVRTLIT
jgi:hypothetical protein